MVLNFFTLLIGRRIYSRLKEGYEMLVVAIVIVILFGIEIIGLRNMNNEDRREAALQLEEISVQDDWN